MENNKENTCSCGCCGGHGSCGSACRSINHHSVIRILAGVIILAVVFFAGFKMGMFFNQAVNGGYGRQMMNRSFDGYQGNRMMLRGWVGEIPTAATGTVR